MACQGHRHRGSKSPLQESRGRIHNRTCTLSAPTAPAAACPGAPLARGRSYLESFRRPANDLDPHQLPAGGRVERHDTVVVGCPQARACDLEQWHIDCEVLQFRDVIDGDVAIKCDHSTLTLPDANVYVPSPSVCSCHVRAHGPRSEKTHVVPMLVTLWNVVR